jgi:hypothetical protein
MAGERRPQNAALLHVPGISGHSIGVATEPGRQIMHTVPEPALAWLPLPWPLFRTWGGTQDLRSFWNLEVLMIRIITGTIISV